MNKDDENVTLDALAGMVADGFAKVGAYFGDASDRFDRVDERLDRIENILATMAATLVGVQEELRDLREVVITNHERRISKLEETMLK